MHCEESSLADLGLDEEDMAGASQNVGYLKWRWNNQSAVSTPGLELCIDMTGTDQGPKSQSSYTLPGDFLGQRLLFLLEGRSEYNTKLNAHLFQRGNLRMPPELGVV